MILQLVAIAALTLPASSALARTDRPYTLFGAFPGGANGGLDMSTVAPMNRWQGKRAAILNVFGGTEVRVASMETAWNQYGSVPMLSFIAPSPSSAVASGEYDNSIFLPLIDRMKSFLAGPDGSLGTRDDRRAYFRYAWESNLENKRYSPCNPVSGGSSRSFRRAWRHVHGLFAASGIKRHHLAWVFSISASDASCPRAEPERTYPGRRNVDWLGIDVYASCGVLNLPLMIDWMRSRLHDIDPSKPIGINEVGVSSFEGQAKKNRIITRYWRYVRAADLRMSLWFNVDKGDQRSCKEFEKPWAVFGQTYGDERYTDCVEASCDSGQRFLGFSAYRDGVGRAWVKGSDRSHPRYLSTRQFLGR